MKFTLSWLRNHLDFDNSIDELLSTLIQIGIEVENVTDYNEVYKSLSVGYIKSTEKHANADKLQVCIVDTKEGELQIVCGADNARAGIYVIYAPIGTYLPAIDLTLKPVKIRGIDSFGMMVSSSEIGLSNESDGILEFNEGSVGLSAAEILGLNDVVIDISITPNRGDVLGVRGIAKDLASFGFGKLKPLTFHVDNTLKKINSVTSIKIDKGISKKFLAAKIRGVKNIESPSWLKNKLKLIGQESRGSLVDISNFICFDLNQPMHCYDLLKIQDSFDDRTLISVEYLDKETKYITLDEKEYILSASTPVVKVNDKIGAIAGVKGGLSSSCDENTSDILLECAHFDDKLVALSKRRLGINTESAYRYERKIDIQAMKEAFHYAIYLITSICGGKIEDINEVEYKEDIKAIEFDLDYINQLVGIEFSQEEVINILQKLDFDISINNSIFRAIPPSRRNDIDDKSVIVSEIIRYYGIDKLPNISILKNSNNMSQAFDSHYKRLINTKKYLAKMGLQEVVSMSFISKSIAELFNIYDNNLVIQNPISEDLSIMRQSLAPSLMILAKDNINRGYNNLSIFEVASIYKDNNPEEVCASSLVVGKQSIKSWNTKEKEYDIWYMKSLVQSLINDLGFNFDSISIDHKDIPSYYHPYRSASLYLGKTLIGYFGEIHPSILSSMSITTSNISVSEVFINRLPVSKSNSISKKLLTISEFMPTKRDFSFIVDKNVTAGELIRLVKSVNKKIITNVIVFDVYEGENIDVSKKSIAITVTLESFDKTFVEDDLSNISDAIISTLSNKINAKIRDSK